MKNFLLVMLTVFLAVALSGCLPRYWMPIKRGNIVEVQRIIDEGVSKDELHQALGLASTLYPNPEMVELLIKNGADVNYMGYLDEPPLINVIDYGLSPSFQKTTDDVNNTTKIVKILVENNAKVNVRRPSSGETPLALTIKRNFFEEDDADLALAIKDSRLETANILLNYGANPEMCLNDSLLNETPNETALAAAVSDCNFEMVQLLLERGAFVCGWDDSGNTLLDQTKWWYYVAELLVTYGGKTGKDIAMDKKSVLKAPLHCAVLRRDEEKIKNLLEGGTSSNSAIEDGTTPLHVASLMGNEKIVDILLKNNANVNAINQNGYSPLFFALQQKNVQVAKKLLSSGATYQNITSDGKNALHFAAMSGSLEITKDFFKKNFDINLKDAVNRTPLFYAALNQNYDVASFLINNSADVSVTDKTDFSQEAMDNAAVIYALSCSHEFLANEKLNHQDYDDAKNHYKQSSDFYSNASDRYNLIAENMKGILRYHINKTGGEILSEAIAGAIVGTAVNKINSMPRSSSYSRQMAEIKAIDAVGKPGFEGPEGYSNALPYYQSLYNNTHYNTHNPFSLQTTNLGQNLNLQNQPISPDDPDTPDGEYRTISKKCIEKSKLCLKKITCLDNNPTEETIKKCLEIK